VQTDYLVYEHWRTDTNTCFYVGKSNARKRRATNMSMRSDYHKRVVAKVREVGHDIVVKIVEQNLPEESSFAFEKMRIAYWRSLGVELVNFTEGGDGISGFRCSEEQLIERRRKQKVAQNRPDVRSRRSAALKGKLKSEEHRRKMSENNSMRRPDVRAKMCATRAANGGWAHTPETLDRISQKMKGRFVGEKNHFHGKKHSEEARAKMRAARARQLAEKELGGTAASVAR
jgi:hypothetical protein